MEETKKKFSYELVGAVIFGILALMSMMSFFSTISSVLNGYSRVFSAIISAISSLGCIAGYALIAFSMFKKDTGKYLMLGLLVVACAFFVTFISGFRYFSVFSFILNLLRIAVPASLLALVYINNTNTYAQYREPCNKLWFVPAACFAFVVLVGWIQYFRAMSFFSGLLGIAGFLITGLWIVYKDKVPAMTSAQYKPSASAGAAVSGDDAYCSLAVHVLLLLFTLGIWQLYWVYKRTAFLNCVEDEPPRNPVTKLLLYMFVPFYSIYWIYKSAQRIDKAAAAKGISSDLATLCLILAIFIPIVALILMQDKINAIVTSDGTAEARTVNSGSKQQVNPVENVPDELIKYKNLLDEGIITQEEFDAKKRQLLGL